MSVDNTPSLSIYFAGGAGIKTGLRLFGLINDLVSQPIHLNMIGLDTNREPDYGNNLPFKTHIFGTRSGSGGVRGTNAPIIQAELPRLSEDDLPISDINIIVSSTSGGSGSTISNFLVGELNRRNPDAAYVLFLIADKASGEESENSLKTVLSFDVTASDDDIYMPVALFDNSKGRHHVDKELPQRLLQFIRAMKNMLRFPKNNGRYTPGLHPFAIVYGTTPSPTFSDDDRGMIDETSAITTQVFDLQPTSPVDTVHVIFSEHDGDFVEVVDPIVSALQSAVPQFRKNGNFIKIGLSEGVVSIPGPTVIVISGDDSSFRDFVASYEKAKTAANAVSRSDSALGRITGDRSKKVII